MPFHKIIALQPIIPINHPAFRSYNTDQHSSEQYKPQIHYSVANLSLETSKESFPVNSFYNITELKIQNGSLLTILKPNKRDNILSKILTQNNNETDTTESSSKSTVYRSTKIKVSSEQERNINDAEGKNLDYNILLFT